MIKVISFKICPFVQRVTALLEAKHVPYKIEYINLQEKPQWFLDIAPNGQVPVLITDSGTPLFESDAIAEYLDDAYSPLEADVTAEERALDRAWSYQATKHYLTQCSAMRSPDKETLQERTEKLGKAFVKAEQVLGSGRFFKGDTISNVDIAWLPLLHRTAIIHRYTGYDFISSYPKVKQWQVSLMATGLAEKSVSDDFENVFTDFYLSDSAFLGRGSNCSDISQSACKSTCC